MQRTSGTEDHFTAEEIYKELVMNNYDVGLATVYRVLTQFENARIVVKHQFESNKSVYELNDPLNHDHMVCVDTGETTEFYDEDIKNKQREIAAKHGYELLDLFRKFSNSATALNFSSFCFSTCSSSSS